jgi:hypothetical protein
MWSGASASWVLAEHETFVPQSYRWGVEAQVDFHEPCQSRDFMPESHFRVFNSETHDPTSIITKINAYR